MNNLLTAVDKFREVSIGEAALYAGLGFSVVFAGIALLIFIVFLVGKVMGRTKINQIQPPKKQEPITPIKEIENDLDDETVAVIMAALTAYYQTNLPKCEFTVRRIKRI